MMSPDELNIRLASRNELALVMGIIAQAAAWLANKGIEQWPSLPNEHWRRRITGLRLPPAHQTRICLNDSA